MKSCKLSSSVRPVRHQIVQQRPTDLWGVGVVKHAEDDPGNGVLGVRHVSWRREGGQIVLQGLTEHAVESDVGTQDVALLPAVFLQLLDLGPQTVQVLQTTLEEGFI